MANSWWYGAAWVAFLVVWVAGAFFAKTTERTESGSRRARHILPVMLAAWLFFIPRVPAALRMRIVPDGDFVFVAGAVLTWGGLLFAILARVTLGRNWSGMVQLKRGHQLIMEGPYRIVRHPIYTGVLLAMLGTALGTGELRCFLALPLAFWSWLVKSRHEEEFLRSRFGSEYEEYSARVKALIPGLL